MLFAAVSPAGREGNGGGADAVFDDVANADAAGEAVMVDVAEVMVGAGVGADKRGAECVANSDHHRVLCYYSAQNKNLAMPRNECRASTRPADSRIPFLLSQGFGGEA